MEHLGTDKEVVRDVRTILNVLFELLHGNVELLKRPTPKLAGHIRQIIGVINRHGLEISLSRGIVAVRIDRGERRGVEPQERDTPADNVPRGVAKVNDFGSEGGIEPIGRDLRGFEDVEIDPSAGYAISANHLGCGAPPAPRSVLWVCIS